MKKLAMLLTLTMACCAGNPAYAATEHADGSLTLTKEEAEQTLRNFNMLIAAVNHLKEQIRILEEMKQCKGV